MCSSSSSSGSSRNKKQKRDDVEWYRVRYTTSISIYKISMHCYLEICVHEFSVGSVDSANLFISKWTRQIFTAQILSNATYLALRRWSRIHLIVFGVPWIEANQWVSAIELDKCLIFCSLPYPFFSHAFRMRSNNNENAGETWTPNYSDYSSSSQQCPRNHRIWENTAELMPINMFSKHWLLLFIN